MIEKISPTQAYEWIKNEEAILIDVREDNEFSREHIDVATLSPLSCFEKNCPSLCIPDDKIIIFQCLGGGRSMKAAQTYLQKMNPKNKLCNMTGGITAWKKENLPVHCSS